MCYDFVNVFCFGNKEFGLGGMFMFGNLKYNFIVILDYVRILICVGL